MRVKLQIISGRLRRRYLFITKNPELRPVLTRVRQTTFDILFNLVDMNNALVLDACCGSGILGIESISRGSSKVFFFDINKSTCEELKKNCINLGIFSQCKVFNRNILTPSNGIPVNLVFMDPPYSSSFLVSKMIRKLKEYNWINDSSIIVATISSDFKHRLSDEFLLVREVVIASTRVLFLKLKSSTSV